MKIKNKPLGILILAGINFFILGLASLLSSISIYRNASSQLGKEVVDEFQQYFPETTITASQIQNIMLLQIAVATVFMVSGAGIFLGRQWGRRLTLYFCFFIVALGALTALFNTSLIHQVILQIFYPGVLILYLTGKKAQHYFRIDNSAGIKEEPEKGEE